MIAYRIRKIQSEIYIRLLSIHLSIDRVLYKTTIGDLICQKTFKVRSPLYITLYNSMLDRLALTTYSCDY